MGNPVNIITAAVDAAEDLNTFLARTAYDGTLQDLLTSVKVDRGTVRIDHVEKGVFSAAQLNLLEDLLIDYVTRVGGLDAIDRVANTVQDLKALGTNDGVSVGDMARLTPTGNTWIAVTVGASTSTWRPGNGRIDVADFGMVDGNTGAQNHAAWDDVKTVVSEIGSSDERAWVVVQDGLYDFDNAQLLKMPSNCVIENHGHWRFTGGNAVGGFLWFQSVQNLEFFGGVIDSNFQKNDNAIGFGFVNPDQTVFGALTDNVWVHDLVIKNARHGGSHLVDETDPADVGRGGGKGITAQFGCQNVLVSDVVVDDCDIGISTEGKDADATTTSDAPAIGIHFKNVIVKNSRYMGYYSKGIYDVEPDTGNFSDINLDGVEFIDCASEQTIDASPQNVSELFGVLTGSAANHVRGHVKIRNESGRVTLVRGSWRDSKVTIVADVDQLENMFDGSPNGGYSPSASRCRESSWDIMLKVKDATSLGYLLTGDAAQPIESSYFRVMWRAWNGSAFPVTWPGTGEIDSSGGVGSSADWDITRWGDGSLFRLQGRGTTMPTYHSAVHRGMYGIGFEQGGASTAYLHAPTSGTGIGFKVGGSAKIWATSGGVVVNGVLALNAGPTHQAGSGSPEGAITAPVGSTFSRTDGGAGTSFYVKESGAGNTGWVAK